MDKKIELLKLEYDLYKSYTFVLLTLIITLSIASFSTKGIILLNAMIFVFLLFLISILLMTYKYTKLVSKYSENKNKHIVKKHFSISQILAGLAIGISYLFFGMQGIDNEFIKKLAEAIALVLGIIMTSLFTILLFCKQYHKN